MARLAIDPATSTPVVFLKEAVGDRAVAIWIGPAEAASIAMVLQQETPSRPMTHDLLVSLLNRLGGRLGQVAITSVQDGAYHAEIHLIGPDEVHYLIDARPSDAIAVALRVGAPIVCSAALLHLPSGSTEPAAPDPLSADALREHLKRLGPEDFGRFVP